MTLRNDLKVWLKILVLVGGLSVVTASSSPGLAVWTRQKAVDALDTIDAPARSTGYRRVGLKNGSLKEGQSRTYSVPLVGKKSQGFLAVCDGLCNGLSLSLYNKKGKLVGQGINKINPFTPTKDEKYSIEVSMDSCPSTEPCDFAIGLYQR